MVRYILKNWEIGIKSLITRPGAIIAGGIVLSLVSVLQVLFCYMLNLTIYKGNGGELFLFLGLWQISNSIYGIFFAWSHDRMSEIIFDGKLDFLLLRPMSAFYSLSFGELDISSLFNLPIGVAVYCFAFAKSGIILTLLSFCLMLLFITLGAIVIFLLYNALSLASLFAEGYESLLSVAETLVEFGSRPSKRYGKVFNAVLPIAAALNTAAIFITEKHFTIKHIVPLLISIVILVFVNIVLWRIGIKRYCGASV